MCRGMVKSRNGNREGGGVNDRPSPSSANGSAPACSSISQMPLAFLKDRIHTCIHAYARAHTHTHTHTHTHFTDASGVA
jgi:hypothetical protein